MRIREFSQIHKTQILHILQNVSDQKIITQINTLISQIGITCLFMKILCIKSSNPQIIMFKALVFSSIFSYSFKAAYFEK